MALLLRYVTNIYNFVIFIVCILSFRCSSGYIIIITLAAVLITQWIIFIFDSLSYFPLALLFRPAPSRVPEQGYLRIPPRFWKCNNCENIKGKVSRSRARWMFSNVVWSLKVCIYFLNIFLKYVVSLFVEVSWRFMRVMFVRVCRGGGY